MHPSHPGRFPAFFAFRASERARPPVPAYPLPPPRGPSPRPAERAGLPFAAAGPVPGACRGSETNARLGASALGARARPKRAGPRIARRALPPPNGSRSHYSLHCMRALALTTGICPSGSRMAGRLQSAPWVSGVASLAPAQRLQPACTAAATWAPSQLALRTNEEVAAAMVRIHTARSQLRSGQCAMGLAAACARFAPGPAGQARGPSVALPW